MTVCYSLDVSSVSCLVQTKINMVNKNHPAHCGFCICYFLDVSIPAHLTHLLYVLISGYNLFSGGDM